ncbi:MAG TPA: hypothetical protein DCE44_07175 [Verrucomicrobiales bacterium]|nr:hypothetical protein [Verrucomicrobiales bacterium]
MAGRNRRVLAMTRMAAQPFDLILRKHRCRTLLQNRRAMSLPRTANVNHPRRMEKQFARSRLERETSGGEFGDRS